MRTPWFLLVLAAPASAQLADSATSRVEKACQARLDGLHERSDFPGGSAALILPDGSEVTVTVGMASLEDERKMRASDRMLSGSIGKSYFAAAALELVHEGKLSLDDKVSAHLGEHEWFARLPNAGDITLRQLLLHTTGIPRYVFKRTFWKQLLADRDKVWKPQELLAFVLDDAPAFAAGEGWAYADTNYIVVGMILEKVTGKKAYDYVREHLLEPHGLKDTVPSDRRVIPGLIQGYVGLLRTFGLPERAIEDGKFVVNPQFEWCGGGYCNTPLDLARWAKIYYSGKAFDGDYKKLLLETAPAERYFGPGSGYGPGLISRKTDVGRSLGHDGVMIGYQSSMAWFPELRIAAAFQINKDGVRQSKVDMHRELVELVRIAKAQLEG